MGTIYLNIYSSLMKYSDKRTVIKLREVNCVWWKTLFIQIHGVMQYVAFSICSAFLQMSWIWDSKFYLKSNLTPAVLHIYCLLFFSCSTVLSIALFKLLRENNVCQGWFSFDFHWSTWRGFLKDFQILELPLQ